MKIQQLIFFFNFLLPLLTFYLTHPKLLLELVLLFLLLDIFLLLKIVIFYYFLQLILPRFQHQAKVTFLPKFVLKFHLFQILFFKSILLLDILNLLKMVKIFKFLQQLFTLLSQDKVFIHTFFSNIQADFFALLVDLQNHILDNLSIK